MVNNKTREKVTADQEKTLQLAGSYPGQTKYQHQQAGLAWDGTHTRSGRREGGQETAGDCHDQLLGKWERQPSTGNVLDRERETDREGWRDFHKGPTPPRDERVFSQVASSETQGVLVGRCDIMFGRKFEYFRPKISHITHTTTNTNSRTQEPARSSSTCKPLNHCRKPPFPSLFPPP